MAKTNNAIFERHVHNPILRASDWPGEVNTVFNAGATRLSNGETLLLCRVEARTGISHLGVARSKDGISQWKIDSQPALFPDPNHPEEEWGIEDPRITYLSELKQYAICYTCYSKHGPGVSLALTRDFKAFERIGQILPPENKDAALFPCRIGGCWAMIHRPVAAMLSIANMWISFSPDLRYWGSHAPLMMARSGAWWDSGKIGLSTPPIETPQGWLTLYHGVRQTASGSLYRVGAALWDLENPKKLLRRSHSWIMGPEAPYEQMGDVGGVVFPCGYTLAEDPDALRLYYGAADTSIALATGKISRLLEWLQDQR